MAINAAAVKDRASRIMSGFSTPQLATLGVLGVLTIIAAFAFFRWISAPSYSLLTSGLDAKDAAAVTSKLQSDGVPYKLASSGTSILVPTQKLDAERLALAAAGIPKDTSSGANWDLLDKQGITSSSFQQQVAYQRALEGELQQTLDQLQGVNNATVHLVLPQDQLLSSNQDPARASVQLDTTGTLSDDTVQSVIHTVASAVPNLDPNAVTVTDTAGHLLSDSSGTSSDRALRLQQTYEDALTAQAESMLNQMFGAGHSVVTVNADIDTGAKTIDSETYDPKSKVVLSQTQSKENYGANGPATGVVAIGATPTASASPTNTYNKNDSTTQYGVDRTVTHDEIAPGTIKRLTVAVAIDSGLKDVPPTAQLQSLVANAVGLDPSRGDTISVTTQAFPAPAPAPKVAKPAGGGLLSGNMKGLIGTGVGILLLLMAGLGFLRTVRRVKVVELPVPPGLAALAAGGPEGIEAGGDHLAVGGHRIPALPSGRADASQADVLGVIEQRPDEVAQLLRGWLANAGADR